MSVDRQDLPKLRLSLKLWSPASYILNWGRGLKHPAQWEAEKTGAIPAHCEPEKVQSHNLGIRSCRGGNKVCGASPNFEFEFRSLLCGATLHSNEPYQSALSAVLGSYSGCFYLSEYATLSI
jgi:hypothetical protein